MDLENGRLTSYGLHAVFKADLLARSWLALPDQLRQSCVQLGARELTSQMCALCMLSIHSPDSVFGSGKYIQAQNHFKYVVLVLRERVTIHSSTTAR